MKGSIIILPHPPEVIDVDPGILENMKKVLLEKTNNSNEDQLVDRP